MVVKLTGNINGATVIFERAQGDAWNATIPPSLDGTYVVDLLATYEAGNERYWARYILTVDLAALCVHLEPCPYRAEVLPETYQARAALSKYYATLMRAECGGVG